MVGRKILTVLLSVVMIFGVTGCSGKAVKKEDKVDNNVDFDEFCDELFKDLVGSDAMGCHFAVSDPAKYGIVLEREDKIYGTLSEEDIEVAEKKLDEYIDRLKEFRKTGLSKEQQLTCDTLLWYFEAEDAYDDTLYLQSVIGTSSGILANISSNFVEYIFYDEEDIEDYFCILESLDDFYDEFGAYLYNQVEYGYFPCDKIVEDNIDICDTYFDAEVNPVEESFEAKLEALNLSEEEREDYIKKNEDEVEKYLDTFFEKSRELLKDLKESGKNVGGLAGYGDKGLRLYEAIVRTKTSSDMSVKELIKYIDDRIDGIESDMYGIILKDISVVDIMYEYQPEYDRPEDILNDIIEFMPEDFKAPLTNEFTIKYMSPACEIEGVLAYYVTARIDDISVNNIKINSSEVAEDTYTLYTTLAHEGYPGHLYQYTSFYGNEEVSNVRKALDFIGSTEGWAQYAAGQAIDYLYKIDDLPKNFAELMRLDSEFGYLLMARTDIGVNYEGWDKEKLGKYLDERGLDSDDLIDDLYYSSVADPGSILPYAVGTALMTDMKDKVVEELGEDSIKDFNAFIIDCGILPFPIYEELLEDWISQNK